MDKRPYVLGFLAVVVSGLLWAAGSVVLDVHETLATLIGMGVGGISFLAGFDIGARVWW